jgi:hypothetical protein
MERVVLTMKWGEAYDPDYVNVLYGGVKKNLAGNFRFVCLTDNPKGIRPEVECHAIPNMGLPAVGFTSGAWPKIAMFKPNLYDLQGRALFIDLDSMICDDLGPMFELPGTLNMIREWKRPIDRVKLRPPIRGASGVVGFDLGSLPQIWNTLITDPIGSLKSAQNDQRFIENVFPQRGFWPETWVTSFKRHVLPSPVVNWFKTPGLPPAGTRILAFHGRPRPAELVPDNNQKWGDFWRCGKGAVPWFRNYGIENGGRDEVIVKVGPL